MLPSANRSAGARFAGAGCDPVHNAIVVEGDQNEGFAIQSARRGRCGDNGAGRGVGDARDIFGAGRAVGARHARQRQNALRLHRVIARAPIRIDR